MSEAIAKLVTACGCDKFMKIGRFAHDIRIPIEAWPRTFGRPREPSPDEPPPIRERVFTFTEQIGPDTYEYREVVRP